jgi:hypothetical protein
MPVAKSVAAITGREPHDQPGYAFMGTIVHEGSGLGVVVRTGSGLRHKRRYAAGLRGRRNRPGLIVVEGARRRGRDLPAGPASPRPTGRASQDRARFSCDTPTTGAVAGMTRQFDARVKT